MLRPTVVSPITYFYPLGNTPAVNLTQDLPLEIKDAKLMLAGCGDARNVLFTIYNENGERSLDFTCCDIEPPILARNILLYSLILDGEVSNALWDIYFHVAVRNSSVELLEKQTEKLFACTADPQAWSASQYGTVLGFCNRDTLARVRQVWSRWLSSSLTEKEKKIRKRELSDAVQRAQAHKKERHGNAVALTCIRSAAPGGMCAPTMLKDLNDLYWLTGSLDSRTSDLRPNPTFLLDVDRILTVHYGTEPLLGFHLTTALSPLAFNSPLRPMHSSVSKYLSDTKFDMLKAAQTEFFCWVDKLANFPKEKLRIRFVAADASAFGNTLQQISATPEATTGNWPTESWTFRRLDVEAIGCRIPGSCVPVAFDVIDTSNLCDHLGFLNIATAYFPLLAPRVTSTMYTELLVSAAAGPDQRVQSLMKGDFDTICLLLGMANVESWTNATVDTEADENLMQKVIETMDGVKTQRTQHRQRLVWKSTASLVRPSSAPFIRTQDLVKLVMRLYNTMFQYEDLGYLIRNKGKLDSEELSMPLYNRASFIRILKHIKSSVSADWDLFNDLFYTATISEGTSFVGANYFQDLYVQLHLQNILSVDVLKKPVDKRLITLSPLPLRNLDNIPEVLCLTLEVPARSIKYIGDNMKDGIGIPSLCFTIENLKANWSNVFSSVQAGFGKVKVSFARPRQLTSLAVEVNKVDWCGMSSMVVSMYVPTWMLLQEANGTTVGIGFQPTPVTGIKNMRLGPSLILYKTDLASSPNIYFSEFMPQLDRLPYTGANMSHETNQNGDSLLRTHLIPDNEITRLSRASQRILVHGPHQRSLTEKSTAVRVSQISPIVLGLHIGSEVTLAVRFPRPISAAHSKLRVARKSGYVEIIAPFMAATDADMEQSWMFPMLLSNELDQTVSTVPVALNMPNLNMDAMPRLNFDKLNKLEWVNPYISQMFSTRERAVRDAGMMGNPSYTSSDTPRIDFKDGLLNIYSFVTQSGGAEMGRCMVFGLSRPNEGGIHILLFVSGAVIDINSRTIALDAAVLPLTQAIIGNPQFAKIFSKLGATAIRPINMSKQELLVWKAALPAFVERCRSWSHSPERCEYIKEGGVPLPSGLEDGASPICSCGCGIFPDGFASHKDLKPFGLFIRKYATRMVLSSVFAVPHVEPCFGIPESNPRNETRLRNLDIASHVEKCANCGVTKRKDVSEVNKALSKCGKCLKVLYCSRECQQKHWKAGHKFICG